MAAPEKLAHILALEKYDLSTPEQIKQLPVEIKKKISGINLSISKYNAGGSGATEATQETIRKQSDVIAGMIEEFAGTEAFENLQNGDDTPPPNPPKPVPTPTPTPTPTPPTPPAPPVKTAEEIAAEQKAIEDAAKAKAEEEKAEADRQKLEATKKQVADVIASVNAHKHKRISRADIEKITGEKISGQPTRITVGNVVLSRIIWTDDYEIERQ